MTNCFSYIRDFCILPMPIPVLPFEITLQMSIFVSFVIFAFSIGFMLEKQMKKQWNSPSPLNLILPIIAAALLFLRFGIRMECIKGLILFLLLLYASNSDSRTREVGNTIPLIIAITALIGITASNLPMMILGAICVAIPQLVVAILKPNTYGGADIKIMTACAFFLGLKRGLIAMILGLAVALFCTIIIRKIRKEDLKDTFPVIPYLAFSSFLAYMI
jgi:leader peptidase (prepilin peptidase)/N-methyltransferase